MTQGASRSEIGFSWSGRHDSNAGPLEPKRGLLQRLARCQPPQFNRNSAAGDKSAHSVAAYVEQGIVGKYCIHLTLNLAPFGLHITRDRVELPYCAFVLAHPVV